MALQVGGLGRVRRLLLPERNATLLPEGAEHLRRAAQLRTCANQQPSPGADVAGVEAQSRCRCGQGSAQSRRRCGKGWAQSRRRCGQGRAQSRCRCGTVNARAKPRRARAHDILARARRRCCARVPSPLVQQFPLQCRPRSRARAALVRHGVHGGVGSPAVRLCVRGGPLRRGADRVLRAPAVRAEERRRLLRRVDLQPGQCQPAHA
jgi:hypothetical protein